MDIELLERFLEGRCTAEEARQVKAALDKDPAILEAYMQQAAVEPVQERMPADVAVELLDVFREKGRSGVDKAADKQTGKPLVVRMQGGAVRRWLRWSAAAAVVVGIAVIGWLSGLAPAHEYVTLAATTGIKEVKLPDGSVLWLKPGALVRFDQKEYGGRSRRIELQKGEAFFDVVHNASSPFVVQTGSVRTTDIGTSFDIRQEPGDDRVVVTVATGEVAVSHHDKVLTHMLPGRQISVETADGRYTETSLPLWMPALWKENSIQLTNASFSELAMAMQQLYGVRLQAANTHIHQQTYTIQLKRQIAASRVVEVICLLNQNQFRHKADSSYLIY